jgi:ribonuclease H / adenosylcobalamin/alpha-ribazole phosphatase
MIHGPELPPIPPMTKRLFLVRHGEVINPGGDRPVFYGSMDVQLSPLGEKEALAAAQYLQQFDLECVVSSPLSRAVFGAQAVQNLQHGGGDPTDNIKDSIVIKEGFTELDRGLWCGQTIDEIGPELMARFDACDESVTPEGGESYPFLQKRVLQARDEVLDRISVGRAAAIVSHLQVTRSILSEALQIPTPEMSKLKIATASITCIDYDVSASAAADGTATQIVQFQSFKPNVGLTKSADGAN